MLCVRRHADFNSVGIERLANERSRILLETGAIDLCECAEVFDALVYGRLHVVNLTADGSLRIDTPFRDVNVAIRLS